MVWAKHRFSDVLDFLVSNHQSWWQKSWNVDAVALWLLDSLKDFSDNHPSWLAKKDIYHFFSRLQKTLGDNRHFRLEIILSRLSLDLGKFNSPESGHLQRAWLHAQRALNLKPNLQEATYLQQQTQQRMREAGILEPASDDEEEEDQHGVSSPALTVEQRRKQAVAIVATES